jgi:hypothetical protein
MQIVDEKPETIHLYVVREEEPKPSLLPIVLSVVALSILVAVCVLTPYQQPVTRAIIRAPAVRLPLQTFTAQVAVIPTGVKVYPATTAHGVLTITNGSIISQTIPQGFKLENVITDRAVFVPAGNANGYGYAVVSAHAAIAGTYGNIPALAIDTVLGSSVYIRNLAAFQGGSNAYSVRFVTAQDKQAALATARQHLAVVSTGLHYPCSETMSGTLAVTWRCQFLIYHVPAYMHVTGVRIIGKNLLLAVWFVARPVRIWVK